MQKFISKENYWLAKPSNFSITEDRVEIVTEGATDFWQKTYYGFEHNNAPALLLGVAQENFSFIVKVQGELKQRYDQCGIMIYQNAAHWLKASLEYENEQVYRLGSVVTNHGYSDWASVDVPCSNTDIYYRLSRLGSDFLIEYAYDGVNYQQMRMFHLFDVQQVANIGIYACSPNQSSFRATFSQMYITNCMWDAHN